MNIVYHGALNIINNICDTIPLDNPGNTTQEGEHYHT